MFIRGKSCRAFWFRCLEIFGFCFRDRCRDDSVLGVEVGFLRGGVVGRG